MKPKARMRPCPDCGKRLHAQSKRAWRNNLSRHQFRTCKKAKDRFIVEGLSGVIWTIMCMGLHKAGITPLHVVAALRRWPVTRKMLSGTVNKGIPGEKHIEKAEN